MRIEKLNSATLDGLRKWALAVHGDEMFFDNVALPELWAWVWFQLRESCDLPDWFPSGKWATIQCIEQVLVDEARASVVASAGEGKLEDQIGR